MFRKTIQNIETRTGGYNQQQEATSYNGYNTERHQRYGMNQQQQKNGSSQFGQLKKAQQPESKSQLIIRECDVSQLNHYKKPPTTTMRPQLQQPLNYYQGASYHCTPSTSTTPNSSNKKQRIQLGGLNNGHGNNSSRPHTYDGGYKEPLEEINFIDRENTSLSARQHLQQQQQQSMSSNTTNNSNTSLTQYYDQQFQMLKQFVYQTYQQQAHTIKTLKTQVKTIQVQCMGQLQNFANQISKQLNKQKQDIVTVNKRGIQTQRQLRYFKDMFNAFLKDNEEKIESIVLEMNGNLHKKSKADDQFGVELKSSSHCISGGVGTSMSMNFQTDNVSMKLYNQMSAQLQILKNQLEICKEKISLLDKDTKILQSQTKIAQQPSSAQTNKPKLQLQQVEKIIIEKLSQDRKKYSLTQKLQQLDLKTKDLYKVYQDVDSNIKGMNAEFTRVINGTVIKKEKMIQAKLANVEERVNELGGKLQTQALQDTLRPILLKLLQEKTENTRFIRLRQPTSLEKQKLQSTTKQSQHTYMLDEQDHLLDPHGNYIVQTKQSGAKQKIKIDKNLIYLLESNGIEIKSVS